MTKICENPECGREFEPSPHAGFQKYCRTFGNRCQKRHYAAKHREQMNKHRRAHVAKVNARMEAERLARLGDPRTCAYDGCDVIFTPHPNALNTHKYHSNECYKLAKVKHDRERLTSDPSRVPWGDYRGQNIPDAIAERFGRPVTFVTFGI